MFSRLRYDTCATKAEFNDNVSMFSHAVDVNRFVHEEPCAHSLGIPQTNSVSTVGPQPGPQNTNKAWGDMVQIENDLRGQTRHATRCPAYKYSPKPGVISNKNLFRKEQEPIKTEPKDDLKGCQFIDYSNMKQHTQGE